MNVYDFDGTIYAGDCTLDFWIFCVKKYPKALIALPGAVLACLQFKFGLVKREYFKEKFYQFLKYIPSIEQEVVTFWDKNIVKIKRWYYEQQRSDDLVISASPEFLIAEICERLKIKYIASKVDCKTGKLLGANCRGAEKVSCFKLVYPNEKIEKFYSDSKSDEPLAEIAQSAYLVSNNKIEKWRF